MSNLEGDIRFSVQGKDYVIPDGTYIEAQQEFLPLCRMCKKSPMTCDNDFIKEIEVQMEPGDDPTLEIKGRKRLPSGEMSEEIGLGIKLIDGVKAGIYRTEEELPTPVICEYFTPKDLG